MVSGPSVERLSFDSSRRAGIDGGSNDSDGGLVLRSEVALRYFAE